MIPKEKEKSETTPTKSEGTGGIIVNPLNQFKITMQTAVEWLQEQYNQCPRWEEQIHYLDWEKAKEIERDQKKQLYSESEVLQLLLRLQQTESYDNLYEWFEQFKKK
jgi:hypothetical protein